MSEQEMFELLSAEIEKLREELKARDIKWIEEKASIVKEVETVKEEMVVLKQQVQKLKEENVAFITKRNENNGGHQMGTSSSGNLAIGQGSFIREVEGDLFSCQDHVSLAHCVSADFHMGKGIAAEFKRRFKEVENLKSQGKGPGQVAFLKRGERYIYYLVTKLTFNKKSTYETIQMCLAELKRLAVQHEVKELAMPRIGTGLERMEWKELLVMINNTFEGLDITITVYEYTPVKK